MGFFDLWSIGWKTQLHGPSDIKLTERVHVRNACFVLESVSFAGFPHSPGFPFPVQRIYKWILWQYSFSCVWDFFACSCRFSGVTAVSGNSTIMNLHQLTCALPFCSLLIQDASFAPPSSSLHPSTFPQMYVHTLWAICKIGCQMSQMEAEVSYISMCLRRKFVDPDRFNHLASFLRGCRQWRTRRTRLTPEFETDNEC